VDNQLYGTILPVAILSMNGTERSSEFISFHMQKESKFNTLKMNLEIKEFELKIDQTFLFQILALVAFILQYFNQRSAIVEEKKLFAQFKQKAQRR
jgi:hypothetical protein